MLDEGKKEILDQNLYINKRRKAKAVNRMLVIKRACFLCGCLSAVVILALLYFLSAESRYFAVSVEGNVYLKDSDIVQLAAVSAGDIRLIHPLGSIAREVKASALIKDCQVSVLEGNVLRIEVEEYKQLGHFDNQVLLENGELVQLRNSWSYLLNNIPYIEGFVGGDNGSVVCKAFSELDRKEIAMISEVHRYPMSYDENMLELIMQDGNYVFVSWMGGSLVKDYHYIISGLDGHDNSCIYLDEMTNTGYMSLCPWESADLAE